MNDLKKDLIAMFTNLWKDPTRQYYQGHHYGVIIERIKKEYPDDNRNQSR